MKSNCKYVNLGDICELNYGKSLVASKRVQGDIPVFASGGIVGWHNIPISADPGIIIGRKGSVGTVYYSSKPFYCIDTAYYIKPSRNYHLKFLYYLLKNLKLDRLNSDSAVPGLNRDNAYSQTFYLPPLDAQKKIAWILSAFDDKIELNNKINQNLEAQAQAIFKSWFVDFEPFGGKMPKDWKEIRLTDIADFVGGYSYKSSELQASSTAMATIKNFDRNGGFKLDGFKEIIPSSKLKEIQKVDLFDTLVAHTDLTQNADVIGNAEMLLSKARYSNIIISMDVVKVIPKNGLSKFLLAALLKDARFKKHCLCYVNGTTVLHLSKKALPEYIFAFPNDVENVCNITNLFESIYRKMARNIEENTRLSELCDT